MSKCHCQRTNRMSRDWISILILFSNVRPISQRGCPEGLEREACCYAGRLQHPRPLQGHRLVDQWQLIHPLRMSGSKGGGKVWHLLEATSYFFVKYTRVSLSGRGVGPITRPSLSSLSGQFGPITSTGGSFFNFCLEIWLNCTKPLSELL